MSVFIAKYRIASAPLRENAAVPRISNRMLGSAVVLVVSVASAVVAIVFAPSSTIRQNGTIVVQRFTESLSGKARRVAMMTITETSASGAFQRILQADSHQPAGFLEASTGTTLQYYDPRDNTIYAMSLRAYETASDHHRFKAPSEPKRGARRRLPFAGTFVAPGRQSFFGKQLDEHHFHVSGRTTIDGRRALILTPTRQFIAGGAHRFLGTAYVTPRTHDPIAYRLPGSTIRWSMYRVMPATAAHRRLLSLSARHPTARTVHSASAWVRVERTLR
jgi:hypothetical protein